MGEAMLRQLEKFPVVAKGLTVTIGKVFPSIPRIRPSQLWLQAVKGQLDRDKNITSLVTLMKDVYLFVDTVKEFPDKVVILEDTIVKILKQTVECTFFIREYCAHGFGGMSYVSIVRYPLMLHQDV